MKSTIVGAILVIVLMLITGCNPQSVKSDVKVITSGVSDPISFEVVGGEDLGTFSISNTPVPIEIRVTNNSEYPITRLDLVISSEVSAGIIFIPDEKGKSFFPGVGGSCTTTSLESKSTCTIMLQYKPSRTGIFTQDLHFSYHNLLEKQELKRSLTAIAGEPASLFFTNEQSKYSFGVIERTDRISRSITVEVKNGGGLPAQNLIVSLEQIVGSAFRIINHDCPETLWMGKSCNLTFDFTPQNYGPSAPDGEQEDLMYSGELVFEYIRTPDGKRGKLKGYLSALSTSIRGRMSPSGTPTFEFEQTVAGNRKSQKIKLINDGYKEAILRQINVYNESGTHFATCIEEGNDYLECKDPSDLTRKLRLAEFPYLIKDTTNCFDFYSKMNYERLPDGTLSDNLISVEGKTDIDGDGGYCVFEVIFQPSLEFVNSGVLKNIRIGFEYDSTWKNRIDFRNTSASGAFQYTIVNSPYLSTAQLSVVEAEYFNDIYPVSYDSDKNANILSLGRVALITQSKYGQSLKVKYRNRGGVPATLVSFVDGNGNSISNIPADLNSYYQKTAQSCAVVDDDGGTCSLTTTLTPLSLYEGETYTEEERKELMFDFTIPDEYKHFQISYLDGAMFNDDLTLRAPQVINLNLKAFLIEKGLLSFVDAGQGSFGQVINENTEYRYVVIENIGTGTIPYMTLDPSSKLEISCVGAKATGDPCPIEFIDTDFAEGGADFDCFDIVHLQNILDLNPAPDYIAPPITKPGLASSKTCSIALRSKLRGNDVIPKNQYDVGDEIEEHRDFQYQWYENGESEKFWKKQVYSVRSSFSIRYIDGDSGADPANGYYPQITGLGNWQHILGGDEGEMKVVANFIGPGALVLDAPWPYFSSYIYRPGVPSIADAVPDLASGEWGNSVSYGSGLSPISISSTIDAAGYFAAISNDITNNFNNNSLPLWTNEDYVVFGGTYPRSGDIHKFRFKMCNMGNSAIKIQSLSFPSDSVLRLSDSTPVSSVVGAVLQYESCQFLYFEFTPDMSSKVYQYPLDISYSNGVIGPDQQRSILLTVESDQALFPKASVEEESFVVEYDPGTSSATETPTGILFPVPVKLNEIPPVEGSRLKAIKGSNIYAKKRYTVTNSGTEQMRSIKVARFRSHFDLSDQANSSEIIIENDSCSDASLSPSEKCTFELKYAPNIAALDVATYGIGIRYQLSESSGVARYITSNFKIRFEATEPASFEMKFVNPVNLSIYIQDAYGLDLGGYYSSHIWLNDYPLTQKMISNKILVNLNDEKGSFLAQYREFVGDQTAVPPLSENPVRVYDDGKKEIYLSRPCLFGDDELVFTIPDEKKGISASSAEVCELTAIYSAGESEMEKELVPLDTVLPLKYYNNERASIDSFYIFFTGFVEPNRCLEPGGSTIVDVETNDFGTVQFNLNPFTPNNLEWGIITKYRVYYSRFKTVLNNVFDAIGIPYVEIDALSDMTGRIDNLLSGTYYYLLPVAIRETPSGKEYQSLAGLQPQKILIPPPGTFWDSSANLVIDKFRTPISSPKYTTKDDAMNLCMIESLMLEDNGSNKLFKKQLLTTLVSDLIIAQGGEGSDYSYSYIPHWTSDDPVDIAPIFADSYNPSTTTGSTPDATMFYMKPCYDDSCRFLSKIIGGDGEDIPAGAVIYVDGDSMNAAIRCYTDLN